MIRDTPDDVRADTITDQGIVWLVEAKAEASLPSWVDRNFELIEQQLHAHGAVLFRGFGCQQDDFGAVARRISPYAKDYRGGNTPRKIVGPDVYTASELPMNLVLPQHHEMMISLAWPMKVLFHCAVAPATGGETPLCGARWFLDHVSPDLLGPFERHGGITYIRNFRSDLPFRSLRETFGTEDPVEIGTICRTDGIDFEWKRPDWLQTRQVRPAFRTHPVLGTRSFVATPHIWHPRLWMSEMRHFGIDAAALRALEDQSVSDPSSLWMCCEYADGTTMDGSVAAEIAAAFESMKISIPWRQGDVLLLDNLLVSHGRNSYDGPRKILAALRQPYDAQQGYVTS